VTDRSLLTELCEGTAQHLVGAGFGRDLMSAGSSAPPSSVDFFPPGHLKYLDPSVKLLVLTDTL
jgi:hypothetical protein